MQCAVHPLVHFATIGQFEGRVIDGNARSSIETSQKSDLLRALSFRAPRCPSGDSPSGDRVDIIVPFYNRRNSVASAVGSALEQTADVTVYAIDDGSEDGSEDGSGACDLRRACSSDCLASRVCIRMAS